MRVLIVTSFPIPGEYDGTAMLPIKITRALRKRGVDVVLAHLSAKKPWFRVTERLEFEGVPLYDIPLCAWASGLGLDLVHREHPFALVHAQHYGGATRAYFSCRRRGWPMVYEIHSLLGDEVARDELGRGLVFRAYLELEKRVLKRASSVIVLGEPVRDVVVREKGVPAERVDVIYPGIDLEEFDERIPPAEIPGISREHKVVMYIGSIVHPNQGVPILIDALPRVFESDPLARCVLVGGPLEAEAEYKRALGGFADRLCVLAGKSPGEVVALARRADVLVHPRLACRENYSVQSKIAVYLAAGRPIVATDFGDYRKLLGESGAGLLAAPEPEPIAQAIVRVLREPELALRMARAAGPVVREYFAMDRNIDRYLEVYHRVIDQSLENRLAARG